MHLGFALSCCAMLSACLNSRMETATIVVGDKVFRVKAGSRVPEVLLAQAGVQPVSSGSKVLNWGFEVDPGASIVRGLPLYLQVCTPINVLLNGKPLPTTAQTVGEVLKSAGIDLYKADLLAPTADSPVAEGLSITHNPAQVIGLQVDGAEMPLRSASAETGAALADAGFPVIGLDMSLPPVSDSFPHGGVIQLARVSESLILTQEPVAYQTMLQDSPDLELGLEQILGPGVNGLALSRTRIKYEDGHEVSRQIEPRVIVQPPQDRLVVRGTKIVEKTISVDGKTIRYWRILQMYATIYSPCNSGTGDGACSFGTASGRPAGKGVVAMDPNLYAFLNGQQLYIPGYGFAVVGDVGGGYIVEKNLGISRYKWIDLGFDDDNIQDMTGWITVYFLEPPPASIPNALK